MPEQVPTPPEQPDDQAGWEQVARDAAQWPADHAGLQALRKNHVNRILDEKGLGHLIVDKEIKAGSRFLHKHGGLEGREVEEVVNYVRGSGANLPDKAGDRTAAYLSFMADPEFVNDGVLTGDPDSVRRQIEAHVIKAKSVPEGYFELQRRIAREQGHGDIEITPEMKRQWIEAAQADQRGSLEKWVEYLGGDDGSYPDWFKRYTWNSVLKLGQYDKESRKFSRRDETTVAPYPELNREALAYVYDTINKFHVHGEKVDDPQLRNLLKAGNFGPLYVHAVLAVTPDSPEARNEVRGSWTVFHQTDDPRTARRLSGSLQGHGTGWCTAGESTAAMQLQAGDFYVYYTRDEDGKDSVPRVAIRMQQGEVAEVRGVNTAQELEPVMADVATMRLKDLPGGEEYIQRAADMKYLTVLDNKLGKGHTGLTTEEIGFLYELGHKIEGFGYDEDPRIKELQLKAASYKTADILERLGGPQEYILRMRDHLRAHALIDQARSNPHGNFSDSDIRFIYGLDREIITLDPADEDIAKSVDYWRDGQDREVIARLLPEAIHDQLRNSYMAYATVAEQLGAGRRGLFRKGESAASTTEVEKLFARKDREWRKDGIYGYLVEQLVEGTRYNLVVTPNIEASEAQIVALAETFGQQQPYSTYVYDNLYRRGLYSDHEWSGNSGSEAVRLSLIPSGTDEELSGKSVEAQRRLLGERQARRPELHARVPSLLDAVTYWYTLRAQGDKLDNSRAFFKTYIRHFDLGTKRLDGLLYVPARMSTVLAGRAWAAPLPGLTTAGGSRWGKICNLATSFSALSFATI